MRLPLPQIALTKARVLLRALLSFRASRDDDTDPVNLRLASLSDTAGSRLPRKGHIKG